MKEDGKRKNTYVILLRGVTPTGKNKVLMAPLRRALAGAGLEGVRTYIQSGNVIAESGLARPALERLVHEVIRREFGGDIAVVARTAVRFAEILRRNPFADSGGARCYFSLLAAKPDAKPLEELLRTDFSPDRVRFAADTLYTLYATRHSDSRFNNNYFERRLKVAATTRNFNTMTRLAQLSAPPARRSRRTAS